MRTRWDLMPRRVKRPGMLAGGDGSTLSLDFTAMSSLDSRFTFSRSSTATFINSSGLVQYADANLILQSESLATSPWAATNGASVADVSTTNPIGGSTATQLTAGGANNSVLQAPSIAANVPHTVRFWVRGGTSTQMQFGYFSGSFQTASNITVVGSGSVTGTGLMTITGLSTTTWTQVTFVLASPAASGSLLFYPDTASPTVGRTNFVWGVQINAGSTASAYNRTTTSAYHAPRFDYDPTTLAPRGLLIEGSATNLLNWSESFATSGGAVQWNYNLYITRNATQIVGPDGTQNAYRFNETTDNQIHRISTSVTGSAGAYVLSVWVQIIDGSAPRRLYINAVAFMGAGALFDIDPATQTGASGSAVAVSGTAANRAGTWVKYPNNWYRCSLLGTYIANQTIYFQINRASSTTAADDTFAGSTSNGLALWGAQLEAGSGASSYIPTGASTVQRAAESCSIAASSSWLNTASGTFLATWSRGDIGTSARTAISTDYVAGRLLSLNNTNTTGTVVLDWWNGNINRTTGSSSNKAAYTYGQTTGSGATLQLPVRLCVNGSAVATGTFGNGTTNGANVPNPVNWTNFVIGAASESAPYTTASRDWLNNCVRSIKYWPTILPDATLQSLTQ